MTSEDTKLNSDVHFSCFTLEIPLLGKFGPKNQNCQFRLKFGIYNNSTIQLFRPEIPFWGKFGPENKNCQFQVTFGRWNYSNMHNSMVMVIFCFRLEIFFGQIWSKKSKLSI